MHRIQTCLDFYIFFIFTRPLSKWYSQDLAIPITYTDLSLFWHNFFQAQSVLVQLLVVLCMQEACTIPEACNTFKITKCCLYFKCLHCQVLQLKHTGQWNLYIIWCYFPHKIQFFTISGQPSIYFPTQTLRGLFQHHTLLQVTSQNCC